MRVERVKHRVVQIVLRAETARRSGVSSRRRRRRAVAVGVAVVAAGRAVGVTAEEVGAVAAAVVGVSVAVHEVVGVLFLLWLFRLLSVSVSVGGDGVVLGGGRDEGAGPDADLHGLEGIAERVGHHAVAVGAVEAGRGHFVGVGLHLAHVVLGQVLKDVAHVQVLLHGGAIQSDLKFFGQSLDILTKKEWKKWVLGEKF